MSDSNQKNSDEQIQAASFLDQVIQENKQKEENPFPLAKKRKDFFLEDLPVPSWFYEGFLPKASLVFFAGTPGSYKTFFALKIASSLVEERMLADAIEVKNVPDSISKICEECPNLLLIEEEMNASIIQDRLKFLSHTEEKSDFHLLLSTAFKLSAKENISELKAFCLKNKIKLIFMDPFSSVLGSDDENDNAKISEILDHLRREIVDNQEIGASVVLIHHPSKNAKGVVNSLRGAGDIFGKADHALLFEKTENSPETTITCIKSRLTDLSEIPSIKLQFRKSPGDQKMTVAITEVKTAQQKRNDDSKVKEIKNLITQTFKKIGKPTHKKYLIEAGGMKKNGTFDRAWKEMIDGNEIKCDAETELFSYSEPKTGLIYTTDDFIPAPPLDSNPGIPF